MTASRANLSDMDGQYFLKIPVILPLAKEKKSYIQHYSYLFREDNVTKPNIVNMDKELKIKYAEYEAIGDMKAGDQELMQRAIEATEGAYAPYSHFHVGAALRLTDGTIVTGNNQENAAYPSGLCAERTALFSASAQHSQQRDFEALAIVGRNSNGHLCEASPCGACRQVMDEYERTQGHPMRVLCYLKGGRIRVLESASALLPFSFDF